MKLSSIHVVALAAMSAHVSAFSIVQMHGQRQDRYMALNRAGHVSLAMSAPVESTVVGGFIETELRGMAMKLHTRSQAPKEGEAAEKKMKPYTPTRDDYLKFLVDSQHIYQAFEDIVNDCEDLAVFRDTGLERVKALETDIDFMTKEYGLTRPEVGSPGLKYAASMREFGSKKAIPELMCHYYNYYFAHTAGGRMIGKQMSSLLLDKKTLEFYKVCYLLS